jgi:hypothetical protein
MFFLCDFPRTPKCTLGVTCPGVYLSKTSKQTFRPTCFVLQKCSKNYIRMHSCSAKKVVWDAIPLPIPASSPPQKLCKTLLLGNRSPIPIPNPFGVIEKGGVLFIFLKSNFDQFDWRGGGGGVWGIVGSGLGAGFTAFAL